MNLGLPSRHGLLLQTFSAQAPGRSGIAGPRRATESLIALLRHEDRSIRAQAVGALGQLKTAAGAEPLRDLLTDTDSELREAAAAALVAIGPAAVAPLAAIVSAKYGDYATKVAAARCLGEIGDPAAVAPLLVAMNDMTANVRSAAADSLVRLGAAAVPGLLALLQDPGNPKRDEVPAPLAKIGDARAIEALLHELTESPESEWRLRTAAIKALESFPEVPSASFFKLLLDPNNTIRDAAARRLDRAVPGWKQSATIADVVAIARQQVEAQDPDKRGVARGLLGFLERREFAGLIIKALEDPEVTLREQACRILGSWKEPAAIEPLLGRLMDDNGWVCVEAHKALQEIDPSWRTTGAGRRARDRFLQHLGDANANVRIAALRGLAEFKDPTTVAAVAGRLTDTGCYVRDQAVHTLKAIGGKEAVQHIIGALRDSDSLIRSAAARCLEELAAPEALEPLQRALQVDTSPAAEKIRDALGKLREAGFRTSAAEAGEETAVFPMFDAGVTILKFPRGFERQHERHWRLVAELKRSGALPELAAHRAIPKADLPALIILTGPPGAIGALGKVYFTRIAEEFVHRECGGDWQAFNPASSLSNVADPGATVDIHAFNEFTRQISPANYTMAALGERIHSEDRRLERQDEPQGVRPQAGGRAASGNLTCPQCRTVYNRREVIRQLRQASPFLFDSATWTTKFRCVRCSEVLIISGSATE